MLVLPLELRYTSSILQRGQRIDFSELNGNDVSLGTANNPYWSDYFKMVGRTLSPRPGHPGRGLG